MKKALAFLLAMTLIIALIPANVFATNPEGGEGETYAFDETEAQEKVVESIQIQDVDIFENYYTGGDNYGNQYYVPHTCAIVTFTDGDVWTVYDSVYVNGKNQWLEVDSWEMQRQDPWERGTYQVTGTFMGVSDTFYVNIIENPVESIHIQDVEIFKGSHIINTSSGDTFYDPQIVAEVTLKDGTVEEIYGSFLYNDQWYDLVSNMWQMQSEDPWTVGTYQVTGSLLGISDTFRVTILESPIRRIEIQDIELFEGDCNNGVYYPESYGTVTFKDGNVTEIETFGFGVSIDDEYYQVETNYFELQQESPWELGGTYVVTATLLGVTDTFRVTIVESPIQSIAVQDIELVEGTNCFEYDDGSRYYNPEWNVKVTFKDGTVQNAQYDIEINGKNYAIHNDMYDLQYEGQWVLGNSYAVTVSLLNVETKFNVTIVENPIAELQLLEKPRKTSYISGELFDLKGATIRIRYKDNSYEDVVFKDTLLDNYYFYSEKMETYTDCYLMSPVLSGSEYVDVKLFGKRCRIPVTVTENLMQSITVKENADKTLSIQVKNTDNTSYSMTLIDCITEFERRFLVTDKGVFHGTISENNGGYTITMWYSEDDRHYTLESNVFTDSQWLNAWMMSEQVASTFASNNPDKTLNYDGKITAENIDALIELAAMLYYGDEDYLVSETDDYVIVRAEGIRKALKSLFGISTVDLKLSKQYDAKADTYCYVYKDYTGVSKLYPSQVVYSNGAWTAKVVAHKAETKSADQIVIDLKMNNSGQVISFIVGDASHAIFKDVDAAGWQFAAAKYVFERGLMTGKGTDASGRVKFDPNSRLTREEFVQVLYNSEDRPSVTIANKFPDVKNDWYKNAVLWANETGVVMGMGNGKFGIGKNITRQDLAVMLYRYAQMKGYSLYAEEGRIDVFADGNLVSDYAETAMNWAVTNTILGGKGTAGADISTFRLDPLGNATRAECAVMLKNFMTTFEL